MLFSIRHENQDSSRKLDGPLARMREKGLVMGERQGKETPQPRGVLVQAGARRSTPSSHPIMLIPLIAEPL